MKIKFVRTEIFNTVNPNNGRTGVLHVLANSEYEVEHIRKEHANHVSIWLKNENVILPNVFNNKMVFEIII